VTGRLTVKTVADAAGVSPATVSNAYNRPERLSAQLRVRILAIADELGYGGPDPAARSLRTRRAGAIGAIFTTGVSYAFCDPFCTTMLAGVTDVTERSRTALVLIPIVPTGDEDGIRESVDAVRRAVIDGAFADDVDDAHPVAQLLHSRNVPLVRSIDTGTGRCVLVDDRGGGRALGRYLRGLGHREVAVLVAAPSTGDDTTPYAYSRDRLAGIRAGLGSGVRVTVVNAGPNGVHSGRLAAGRILTGGRYPTAIAATTDALAFGVLDAARERGLTPGRDLAVTGFDDVPGAETAGLTTIRQPIRERGRLVARMLLDPTFTDRRVRLRTELVVRATAGPAGSTPGGRT
jgi:DNA-binding LacI/PurR family transcriptional regulator